MEKENQKQENKMLNCENSVQKLDKNTKKQENASKNSKNEQKLEQNKKSSSAVLSFLKTHKNKLAFAVVAILVAFVSIFSVMLGGGLNSQQPLKVRASSNMLRMVQAKLTEKGYYTNTITGNYDDITKSALGLFQKDNHLLETGDVNEATLTALGVSDNEQTNNELYLLAKLIYSEARGEIYTGQVAVGAVVLNRVEDPGFPNTLQGVIYQPWAFTALHDGQFDLEPNATAYQAAQDAMNGWDPSYGSLYYYNPKTATSSWIFSRTTVVVIGNHVFAI